MSAWRHALSILLLPFFVVIVLPAWVLRSWAAQDVWLRGPAVPVLRVAGVLAFGAGLGLFTWCVILFARIGRGTLAPWDPTRRLVAAGPYQYVRNPMISGVAAMLLGEALYFGSVLLLAWLMLFVAINHAYFVLSEEPGLERRFGAAYREYRRRVPRWIPRRPRDRTDIVH